MGVVKVIVGLRSSEKFYRFECVGKEKYETAETLLFDDAQRRFWGTDEDVKFTKLIFFNI